MIVHVAAVMGFFFSFWPEESGPRNVDAFLLQSKLGNPCDTQQHQPQTSTKTPSGGPQLSRGLGGLISSHFLLCSLCALILCLRQFFSSFVILFHTWSFFFPPKCFIMLCVLEVFCFIASVGGCRGAAVCLKRLNLFWWRDIPPSASILPLTRQDVM